MRKKGNDDRGEGSSGLVAVCSFFGLSVWCRVVCVCFALCVWARGGLGFRVPRRSALGINLGAPVLAGFGAF